MLVQGYVEDAGLMLQLHRAGAARGETGVELPKTLLEMVRCLVLVRRLDPRDEAAGRRGVHDALWRDLLATEALPPGPSLDRQLARLASSWQDFARVTADELRRAPYADRQDAPATPTTDLGAGDRAVGAACAGSTHTHPLAVQSRLRHQTPCPGLVDAAARAFAPL